MITYEEVLSRLKENGDEEYRAFHSKLLKNDGIHLIGIRTPVLRALAREWKGEADTFLGFPDDYYEITFLKCALVGALKYDEFIKRVDRLVPLLNNWATCDTFDAPCVKKHREEFLPFIKKYLQSDKEFTVRYGLVMLLHYYVEEEYLHTIYSAVNNVNTDYYYVHMAAAWLIAEVLVKNYESGLEFIKTNALDIKTHNKAIQKACESFRLTSEQKEYLKTLKR